MEAERQRLIDGVVTRFGDRHGGAPTVVAAAPGRINLIGEHTDYNAGLSLAAAVDRWVAVGLRPRTDDRVTVTAVDLDAERAWSVGAAPERGPGWVRFAVGALALVRAEAPGLRGVDAVVQGTVPQGSGLSSSAALALAWLTALAHVTGQQASDLDRARQAQAIEHRFLGVSTGLLDPLAIQLARPGHAVRLDFAALSWRYQRAQLDDWCWLTAHSGVTRELAHSAYGERVRECRAGLADLRGPDAPVTALRGLTVDSLDLDTVPGRRLRHVITENERVDAAVAALGRGDPLALGALLAASHQSLATDFQVSHPALDALVALAGALPGCAGARMMGGGFGGCTLNLVHRDAVDDFSRALSERFALRLGRSPAITTLGLGGGVHVWRSAAR